MQIEMVRDGHSLLEALEANVAPRRGEFGRFVEEHGDCDLRLVRKIHALLAPILGEPDLPASDWFQSMDFHCDGIRHLEFRASTFPNDLVSPLQALLAGEHAEFGILCWLDFQDRSERHEGLLIFHDKIVATPVALVLH